MDEWKVIFTQLLADSGFFQTLYDAERTKSKGERCRMSEWIEKEEVLNQIDCWFKTGEYKYSNATHYLNKRISSIKPKINWISVKNRLPDRLFEDVLTYDGREIRINWLEELIDDTFYFAYGESITHWMPIPEPPDSEDDAE